MSGNGYHIAVVDRTLDLLEALAEARGPAGVSDLAREIGATKSAVFRILVNLERRGYVVRDPDTSKYQLGGRLAQLGHLALETLDLRTRARPVIEALHERFNETVNLAMLVDSTVTYIDMIQSDHGLRMAAQVGATDAMHCSALGKSILSFLPEEEQNTILSGPLERRTDRTLTDPALLRKEIEKIRLAGVAEDRGENEDFARCLGAPIFDYRGTVIGAISVSSPLSRLDDARGKQVAKAVRDAARQITSSMGGAWPIDAADEEIEEVVS